MQPRRRTTPKDRRFLARFENFIAECYVQPALDVKRMATPFGVSERQLQRKLKGAAGCSPSQYLRDYRLQKSLEGQQAGLSIGEVAKAVGFTSQSYFTTCFKARFGTTPSEYQNTLL